MTSGIGGTGLAISAMAIVPATPAGPGGLSPPQIGMPSPGTATPMTPVVGALPQFAPMLPGGAASGSGGAQEIPAGFFICFKCRLQKQLIVVQARGNQQWCGSCVSAYSSLAGRWKSQKNLRLGQLNINPIRNTLLEIQNVKIGFIATHPPPMDGVPGWPMQSRPKGHR